MRVSKELRPGGRAVLGLACAALFGSATAACDQHVGGEPDGGVASVDVVHGEVTVTVDLGDLDAVVLDDGEEHARLADVVEAASLDTALEDLEFDFEAADGFRSSSTPTCEHTIPIVGALLRSGHLNLRSRDMSWDEALDLPGCVYVTDLARIHAADR